MPRLVAILFVLVASGCRKTPEQTTELVVLAASSLTESFREIERAFEQKNPAVDVQLNFAGSQVLRLQIEQGAPADLFASANGQHVNALLESKLLEDATSFAQSKLALIVPEEAGSEWTDFYDIARMDRLVIGTEESPIGLYTRQLFQNVADERGEEFAFAILQKIASEESNVRLVRAKVELGEANAAIVYQTDFVESKDVVQIPIPAPLNVEVSYSMGIVRSSKHISLAKGFLDFVLSETGQNILGKYGFSHRGNG